MIWDMFYGCLLVFMGIVGYLFRGTEIDTLDRKIQLLELQIRRLKKANNDDTDYSDPLFNPVFDEEEWEDINLK